MDTWRGAAQYAAPPHRTRASRLQLAHIHSRRQRLARATSSCLALVSPVWSLTGGLIGTGRGKTTRQSRAPSRRCDEVLCSRRVARCLEGGGRSSAREGTEDRQSGIGSILACRVARQPINAQKSLQGPGGSHRRSPTGASRWRCARSTSPVPTRGSARHEAMIQAMASRNLPRPIKAGFLQDDAR